MFYDEGGSLSRRVFYTNTIQSMLTRNKSSLISEERRGEERWERLPCAAKDAGGGGQDGGKSC